MSLRETLSTYWQKFQGELFPFLEETVGFLTESHRDLVTVLDLTRLEAFVPYWHGVPGRPPAERAALARAFVAKAVLNLPTTRMLIERVEADKTLRRLCGWSRPSEVPSEATFSRAFAEFADSALPSRLHEALIRQTHADRLVGHIARDSTAIEGHEKPQRADKPETPAPERKPRKRGRPRKGEEPAPKPPSRLERQAGMTLRQMLADLPRPCDVGVKRNAKGYQRHGSAISCTSTPRTATFPSVAFSPRLPSTTARSPSLWRR